MERTDKIYGKSPVDIGLFDIETYEMMFWMYCPIKLPSMDNCVIPDNIKKYEKIIQAVKRDVGVEWHRKYIYITAKTLFATPDNPGNRPGWHSDGFLTNDLNYIWCDANPTVFYDDGSLHDFPKDHRLSLSDMGNLCESNSKCHKRYDLRHLLRLDQSVLHKVDTCIRGGVRTFVKVSVSDDVYSLKGNSVNHQLNLDVEYKDRQSDRNCPIG